MGLLRFELSMPNVGSWNGKDTGRDENLFVFRNVDSAMALRLLETKNFYYDFGDGWGANIQVTKNKRTKSNGFRGYEWMVNEIITYGKLYSVPKRRLRNKLEKEFALFAAKFTRENDMTDVEYKFLSSGLYSVLTQTGNYQQYLKDKEAIDGIPQKKDK